MGAIGALRSMTKAGKLGIIPCHVGQVGPLIECGAIPCDVAMVQVSPADADGNHSFGLISDHTQAMIAKAHKDHGWEEFSREKLLAGESLKRYYPLHKDAWPEYEAWLAERGLKE